MRSERGDGLSGTFTAVFLIILSIGVMVGIPMLSISSQNDKISQILAQQSAARFISTSVNTKEINSEIIDRLIMDLHSDKNTYDYKLEVQRLDENPAKGETQTGDETVRGENLTISIYRSQIDDEISKNQKFKLLSGDTIILTVYNTNITAFRSFINSFFNLSEANAYAIYVVEVATVA